eukprot:TRINITY_DN29587_c0_g2_i3.p1 TRINITY_DN29587_c0_g2~~TRINITY_DN29587_c0_g2_i3.p1  ORF type:complete len:270 (+),score=36.34 TRINITY_DN29587_c0_g2_i3:75-812(+)
MEEPQIIAQGRLEEADSLFPFADSFLDIVEKLATVCALFFLLSPTPLVLQVHRTAGTALASVSPTNLLSMYLNCSMWVIYGMYLPMPPAVPANAVGVLASVVFLSTCWLWAITSSSPHWGPRAATLTVAAFLFSVVLLIYASNVKSGAVLVGYFGMVFNIVMYAAPLSVVQQVLKDRSSSQLPRLQCVLGFSCSALWLTIGVSKDSAPIAVPNLAGLLLSGVQLFLIARFPAASKTTKAESVQML